MIELEANTKEIGLMIDECVEYLNRAGTLEEFISFFRIKHNCTIVPYNWNHHYKIHWSYLLVFDDPGQETLFRLKYSHVL